MENQIMINVDTPFLANIKTDGIAKQPFTEWGFDKIQADGSTQLIRVGNYLQISYHVAEVEDPAIPTSAINLSMSQEEQESIREHRVAFELTDKFDELMKQLDYEESKVTNFLIRDIEVSALSDNEMSKGSETTPRVSRGLGSWLTTNVVEYTDDFTKRHLDKLIDKVHLSGGDIINKSFLMMSPDMKMKFSDFEGLCTRYEENAYHPVGAADVYMSDYGNIDVVPNRFMPKGRVYLIDPSLCDIAFLRPIKSQHVPSATAGCMRRVVICEWTLRVQNEVGMGQIRLKD